MKKFVNMQIICFAVLSLGVLLCGCKKKSKSASEKNQEILKVNEHSADHKWYYFTQDGFGQIDLPQNAPFGGQTPYTEAVRISCANNAVNSESDQSNKAFALVNRLGVLCFEGDKLSLAKDISIFSDRTAGNLVFINDTAVFSVYKSAFFNDTISSDSYKSNAGEHLFLVQFDDESKISYPIINSTNLINNSDYEVTDFFWDGSRWLCCLKKNQEKTDFVYLKFSPAAPLLSITPVSASDLITVRESSVQEFRDVMSIKDYSKAPERIRRMLKGFSDSIPFIIEVKSAGGNSPRIYENKISGSFEEELKAKAIISQSWSAALFEDGTLFIEGALPGKHILRGGNPVAIRLPKMEEGYVYSDFVISGTTLYAAWEQTDFYKTNRSGFLSVDLDSTLYSKIR